MSDKLPDKFSDFLPGITEEQLKAAAKKNKRKKPNKKDDK